MSLSNKDIIEKKLSTLLGTRIIRFRRAALMIGIDFESDIKYKKKIEEKIMKTLFSLHIHSSWRLLKSGVICLGQSDLFTRDIAGFKYCEDGSESYDDSLFFETVSEINGIFEAKSIKVVGIKAASLGDISLFLEDEYCIEVFIDARGNSESWRFFSNTNEANNLVVFNAD